MSLRPLKIFYLTESLGTGGAERSLAEMLPGLVDRGIRPTVVCLQHRSEGVEQQVLTGGFDVRFLEKSDRLGRARQVRSLIESEQPRLVHTTLFEANLAGRLAAVGTGLPVLTSLVNTEYVAARLEDPRVKRWRLQVFRLVDGWTARHLTTHFHALSKAVKEAAVKALGIAPERVTVIRRGRDPGGLGDPGPDRRRRVRAELGLDEDQPILITAGRQEFQKGHRSLLEAVPLLASRYPNLVILIAGREGNASADLRLLQQELGLHARVRFLGHRDDVPDLLAASDMFVFPSLFEGFGGAVIEAMALGLPVVACDIPVMQEILEPGGNALLVPPSSSEHLAAAVSELLDDPTRAASFGARSRRIFEARFTLEGVIDKIVDLYQRLARRGRR